MLKTKTKSKVDNNPTDHHETEDLSFDLLINIAGKYDLLGGEGVFYCSRTCGHNDWLSHKQYYTAQQQRLEKKTRKLWSDRKLPWWRIVKGEGKCRLCDETATKKRQQSKMGLVHTSNSGRLIMPPVVLAAADQPKSDRQASNNAHPGQEQISHHC